MRRRVLPVFLYPFFALTLLAQTGAGADPAQPQPSSTANLGIRPEVLPWDQGQAGINLLFKKLRNTGRVMHLTAHPDDEDGPLMTLLARGHGRQVLLMSLTRGEGGQNRIGSNLWDELGVLRTLELLESCRYYGVELRFSRVADFGYSKSADEAFKKWGGQQVPLRDIVYVIREWKPDVLFSRFGGTPRDGHGMHQAAGILAPLAVKCAAAPNCFPDQLKGKDALTTWQVLKFYTRPPSAEDYTVRYDVSQVDPDTKLRYAQMALEGFKHQASQLSGDFRFPAGPVWRPYKLIFSALPKKLADGEKEQDFFDGIDTSLAGLTDVPASQKEFLASAQQNFEEGFKEKSAEKLLIGKIRVFVARGNSYLALPPAANASLDKRLKAIEDVAMELASKFTPVRVGARIGQDYLHPGSQGTAWFTVKNEGAKPLTMGSLSLTTPGDTRRHTLEVVKDRTLPPGGAAEANVTLQIEPNAPVTRQHWIRTDYERDTVYRVADWRLATLPLPPAPFSVTASYKQGKLDGVVTVPLKTPSGKTAPILDPVSVLFNSPSQVRPQGTAPFEAQVTVRALAEGGTATVHLIAPDKWKVTPAQRTVALQRNEAVASFTVQPPQSAGTTQITAEAIFDKTRYTDGFSVVTRSDLDTFYYHQPALQRVSIVDVNVPKNLRVGYIPGAGDDIFPVLQQLGINAKLISDQELANGDLKQYDSIVVGIRGYDERPQIRAAHPRLLDFVKEGGTLIVQNHKDEQLWASNTFTPYPATLGRERVSVEEAPVDILAPNDPLFNLPNKITQADFDGWVQERGINFMSKWGPQFEPLLASADPGEQPLKGGMLRAKYGKGNYIYTGYAFFRQLPAGVPGAVRLYVNLLTVGHENK